MKPDQHTDDLVDSSGHYDPPFSPVAEPHAAREACGGSLADIGENIDIGRTVLDGLGLSALDAMPIPTLILDINSKAVFLNRIATVIMPQQRALFLGADGICRGVYPDATTQLHDTIRNLCQDRSETLTGCHLVLPTDQRESGATSSVISLRRLSGQPSDAPKYLVAVFFGTAHISGEIPDGILEELFGLTRSEARLVRHLVRGASLNDIATRMGVTINTVRTYLKRIFSKTGTSRQVELVRMVLNAVPQVPAGTDT